MPIMKLNLSLIDQQFLFIYTLCFFSDPFYEWSTELS